MTFPILNSALVTSGSFGERVACCEEDALGRYPIEELRLESSAERL